MAMKRVELKRIAEIFWKVTPEDEKMPFASQGVLPDNGSFSKPSDSDDSIKKSTKEFSQSLDEKKDVVGPMSITRKFCFVMSFNLWILYFLALSWLIPCRNLECDYPFPDIVETNLSSFWLLTNVETMNMKGLPSLTIIGYADGAELKLSALSAFDASFEWNNTLPFIPRKIQCNFQLPFDVNGDGINDCLLSGYNDVYAFNATNGHMFWHQNIPSEEGNILGGFHPTRVHEGASFLIGTCGDKLIVLGTRNGSGVSEVSLPCNSPFEIKIVPNVIGDNFTLWNLVCDYGDEVEAWGFGEQDVLSEGKLDKKANVSEFALLFSGTNSGRSIDLGCDVTPIPGGPLLLSWADRVAMVTQEATAWERHFPELLTVANIKLGHFSNPKELQIAAAVRNATSTILYLMELKNGSTLDSIMLQGIQAQSMDKIPGDVDSLVLKSISFNYTSEPVYSNLSDPIPAEQTNFKLIDFSNGKLRVRDIVTTSVVVGSAVNAQPNGETDLLIFKSENGLTSYQKYMIRGIHSQDSVLCIGSNHARQYSMES